MVLSRSAMLQVIKPLYPEKSGIWISAPVQEMKKDKLKRVYISSNFNVVAPMLVMPKFSVQVQTSELPT